MAVESGLEPLPAWYKDLFDKVLSRVFKDFNFKKCRVVRREEDGFFDMVDPSGQKTEANMAQLMEEMDQQGGGDDGDVDEAVGPKEPKQKYFFV